jgi:adenine phosphoribosyltransferase
LDLKSKIRTIPDWPKKGIMFRDVTTLLQDKDAFKEVMDKFCERYKDKEIDVVVGIESRGFIFGAVLAYLLGKSFVPVRKEGKLPYKTMKQEYALEYGNAVIEIHKDAIQKGQKVLIVDDLIATAGTLAATIKLVELFGAEVVECAVLIELIDLKGREKLANYDVFSLIEFEGE